MNTYHVSSNVNIFATAELDVAAVDEAAAASSAASRLNRVEFTVRTVPEEEGASRILIVSANVETDVVSVDGIHANQPVLPGGLAKLYQSDRATLRLPMLGLALEPINVPDGWTDARDAAFATEALGPANNPTIGIMRGVEEAVGDLRQRLNALIAQAASRHFDPPAMAMNFGEKACLLRDSYGNDERCAEALALVVWADAQRARVLLEYARGTPVLKAPRAVGRSNTTRGCRVTNASGLAGLRGDQDSNGKVNTPVLSVAHYGW